MQQCTPDMYIVAYPKKFCTKKKGDDTMYKDKNGVVADSFPGVWQLKQNKSSIKA